MFASGLARFFHPAGEKGPWPPFAYFSRPPRLETEHLLLRPLSRKDAGDIYAYASDPEVARYVLWEPHRSPADSRAYVRYVLSLYRRGLPSCWAAEERTSGRVIGTIGFMWYSEAAQSAEVGYSFSREVWNRGYATEALRAVLYSAFSLLPLNRVEAQHDVRNPASGRVMVKAGMTRESILRQRVFNKGEWIDVALYSILRQDPAWQRQNLGS